MDPLQKAVKRKGWVKEEVINDPVDGPIYKIDIKGDEDGTPDDADDLAQAPSMPVSAPEGGFGGEEEPFENDDDGPLSPEEQDDGAEVEAARARFRQGQAETGEDPMWDDPYNEPDDAEYESQWNYFSENPSDLDANAFTDAEVAAFRKALEAQNIDPGMVYPRFLRSRFDLTTPESFWLEKALNGSGGPEMPGRMNPGGKD